MLGRFLEFSVISSDLPASLGFYRDLGFSEASVGDAWSHAYAVVTDGRICIGLHDRAPAAQALTFVRPDLLKVIDELDERGIELKLRRLGDMEFNEIGFEAPCGMLVRMIEARSFSPSIRRSTETSACGYFEEIALPAADIASAKAFWEQAGFVGMDAMHERPPHVSCTSDFIDIGLYEDKAIQYPLLRFEAAGIKDRIERLAAAGVAAQAGLPKGLAHADAALLIAPEGTRILLCSSGEA